MVAFPFFVFELLFVIARDKHNDMTPSEPNRSFNPTSSPTGQPIVTAKNFFLGLDDRASSIRVFYARTRAGFSVLSVRVA